jgi:hypothetical protein
MRRFISIAIFIAALAVLGVSQTAMTPAMQNAPARKSPLADYAGAWIGTVQGHTWMNVRLTLQGNQISGTLQRAHEVQFDNSGAIKSVGDEQSTGAVENAIINGDGLMLTVKDPGSQQTDRYLLRLTGANTAEMKMVAMSMPPGMAKPQPWKLSRVGPNAVTPVR